MTTMLCQEQTDDVYQQVFASIEKRHAKGISRYALYGACKAFAKIKTIEQRSALINQMLADKVIVSEFFPKGRGTVLFSRSKLVKQPFVDVSVDNLSTCLSTQKCFENQMVTPTVDMSTTMSFDFEKELIERKNLLYRSTVDTVDTSKKTIQIKDLDSRQDAKNLSTPCRQLPNSTKPPTPMDQPLTQDQQRAFDTLATFWKYGSAVATLKGYAGVGKTFTTQALAAHWHAQGLNVLVTASTNKAVAVLAAKMPPQLAAMTIHAALGLRCTEHDDGSQTFVKEKAAKLLDYDITIVDEASMLNDELFASALTHRHGCKLLFVGDPAQLAPVSDHNQLSKAFDPAIVPTQVALTNIVRQQQHNPIIRWAHYTRDCVDSNTLPCLVTMAAMLKPDDDGQVFIRPGGINTTTEWATSSIAAGFDTRVLAYHNKRVDVHNHRIHYETFPNVFGFAPGEPVMYYGFYESPDQNMSVKNSALGHVVSTTDAGPQSDANIETWLLTTTIDDGRTVTLPTPKNIPSFRSTTSALFEHGKAIKAQAHAARSPQDRSSLMAKASKTVFAAWSVVKHFAVIKHAYAMTIHKSQGSTFDNVIIDWQDLPVHKSRPADIARMLYVAMTRARFKVVIVTA